MRQQKNQTSVQDWQELAIKKLESIQNKKRPVALEPSKTKLPEGMRRLKIRPKYLDGSGMYHYVPQIMLQGEWLRNAGFDCEGYVIVSQEPGQLIIRLEESI